MAVRRQWTAAALAAMLAAGPAAALTPLPASCTEPDGRVSTLSGGWDQRFRLAGRSAPDGGNQTALVDCAGTRELVATDNTGARVSTYHVMSYALESRRSFTYEALARMLRDEGHAAAIVQVAAPSCLCELGN